MMNEAKEIPSTDSLMSAAFEKIFQKEIKLQAGSWSIVASMIFRYSFNPMWSFLRNGIIVAVIF